MNRPRTLDSMCRATNPIVVWAGSNVHVPLGGSWMPSTSRPLTAPASSTCAIAGSSRSSACHRRAWYSSSMSISYLLSY